MPRCVGMCWPVLAVLCVILVPKLLFGNEDAEERKPSPYPPTKVDPIVEKIHGVEVVDPYRWLEDGASPAVKEWTDQENAFTHPCWTSCPSAARSTPASKRCSTSAA